MRADLIYGCQPVREAIAAARRQLHRIMVAREDRQSDAIAAILREAASRRILVREMGRRDLDRLCGTDRHQGIALEASAYVFADISDMLDAAAKRQEPPLLLLLDHIQDPQNLGALIRSADGVGADGVVIPRHRAAGITSAVIKASAGAVEHMRVAEVGNLAQTMETLKEQGVWIVGLENVPEAQLYSSARLDGPLALVVGSEGEGMSRLVRERCDFWIRLPMRGRVGSLNVSAATAIALYEIRRQRDQGTGRTGDAPAESRNP